MHEQINENIALASAAGSSFLYIHIELSWTWLRLTSGVLFMPIQIFHWKEWYCSGFNEFPNKEMMTGSVISLPRFVLSWREFISNLTTTFSVILLLWFNCISTSVMCIHFLTVSFPRLLSCEQQGFSVKYSAMVLVCISFWFNLSLFSSLSVY